MGGYNMKKIVCFLICMLLLVTLNIPVSGLILVTNNSASSPNDSILVTLTTKNYNINTLDSGVSEIYMKDFGCMVTPGKPMLPTKTFYVGLPPGGEVVSIDLIEKDVTEIRGRYRIQDALPISNSENIITTNYENKKEDAMVESYPAHTYEYLGMSHLRKYSMAMIRFNPFTYYPNIGKLNLFSTIKLRITYKISNDISEQLLADTVMDDIAKNTIVNYNDIAHLYNPSKPSPTRQTYEYVVITTSSLVTSLNGFLTWKTSIGLNMNIVTKSWIQTNYPASDIQQSIRNFLKANYAAWGTKYVLIVGSHASIPMRTCYPNKNMHVNDGIHDIPTDYYYADLTGNWDSDGDGFYGERGDDTVDFKPEVWVGRIPVDVGSSASSITLKTQTFESTSYSGWKKNAMLLGAVYTYANEDHQGNARWDGAEVMEQCRTNLLTSFSTTTMYEKQGLGPCSYACTYNLANGPIITQWGSSTGWGIVNWAAHGATTSASRKVWSSDDGDGVPENTWEITWPLMIQNTDASGFNNNKPPIVFAASCYVSHPETTNNVGTSLLINGASAFIGATRVSYGSMGWTKPSDGGHGTVCYDFTDRIVKCQECGRSLYSAKQYVLNNYPWKSWYDYANMYNFNLYGEPAMGMNLAPGKPTVPSGQTQGKPGTSYPYTTQAIDPTADKVEYGWDWDGDGSVDQWDDNNGNYYPSNVPISTQHAWSAQGTYNIKVKARDISGSEGVWSDPLTVTMPKNNPYSITHFFTRFFSNHPYLFSILLQFLGL
jgi:hypothetical protein